MSKPTKDTPAIGAKRITFDGEWWRCEEYSRGSCWITGTQLQPRWNLEFARDSLKHFRREWERQYGIYTPFPKITVWQSAPVEVGK